MPERPLRVGRNREPPFPNWIQRQLPEGIARGFFSSSLGRIHYLSKGRGKQVFLLHGNPTWSFLWRRVFRELDPQEFELVAPDLMNLGFSDDLKTEEFTLENHIRYMIEFFRTKARRGSILVVQDWGGPIGLLAAAQCRDLFSGFVILNTGLTAPSLPIRLSRFHRLSNTPVLSEFVFGLLRFPLFSLHQVQFDQRSIRGEVARAYRFPIDFRRRMGPLRFARMVPSSDAHPSLPHFQNLEKFVQTIQNAEIVWGAKDPILGRQLRQVKALLPGARLTEVQSGHFVQEESPREIASAITRVGRLC